VQHVYELRIRDFEPVNAMIQSWLDTGRLMIADANQEQGFFSGLIMQIQPDLVTGQPEPYARLSAYLATQGDVIRLSHSNKASIDGVLADVRRQVGGAIHEPQYRTMTSSFGEAVAELLLFPTQEGVDAKLIQEKTRELARNYFETEWLQRPLKSLGGAAPVDAASHPTWKKHLHGLILFMRNCLLGNRIENGEANLLELYDFRRLQRILGLIATDPNDLDFETISAEGLARLNAETLTDMQIVDAFRAAQKLDATELAALFADSATRRDAIADRYPFFHYLAQRARDDGNSAEVFSLYERGQKTDTAEKRVAEYAIGLGRAAAKLGDTDKAERIFRDAIQRDSGNLPIYAAAAETMLSKKLGKQALSFADKGLTLSRAKNNRDAEGQFLELCEAAKKSVG
jgi:tetratricopeptide (TPR) repeat protein